MVNIKLILFLCLFVIGSLTGLFFLFFIQTSNDIDSISFDRECMLSQTKVKVSFFRGQGFGFYPDPNKGERWGDYAMNVLGQIQASILDKKNEDEMDQLQTGEFNNHFQTIDEQAITKNEMFFFSQTSYKGADVIFLASSLNPAVQGYTPPFYQMSKEYLSWQEANRLTKTFVEMGKYWNSHYTNRHTYCHKAKGAEKNLFFIDSIVHRSDHFLSGRACLRSALLSLACVKIDFDQPDSVKKIDNIFFKGGSSDQLTETGKTLLRNNFEEVKAGK